MKRTAVAKFPSSIQLFKFCQKILSLKSKKKVKDQDIGSILGFNPSDCSHWKRGEKNVRSVFSLAKIATALEVDQALIHDLAAGVCNLDEAYFEYLDSSTYRQHVTLAQESGAIGEVRARIENFVRSLHGQINFQTAPLYVPELTRQFSFITIQSMEMIDRLSRILRTKPNHYTIQFKKGDLRPQTRLSMVKDIGRILLEPERARFPELGSLDKNTLGYELNIFAAELLAPKAMVRNEMAGLDSRKNIIAELGAVFWVPKSLISLQVEELVRFGFLAGQSLSLPAKQNDSQKVL